MKWNFVLKKIVVDKGLCYNYHVINWKVDFISVNNFDLGEMMTVRFKDLTVAIVGSGIRTGHGASFNYN